MRETENHQVWNTVLITFRPKRINGNGLASIMYMCLCM